MIERIVERGKMGVGGIAIKGTRGFSFSLTKSQIVAAPLAGRARPEGPQDHVRHALAGQHVAAHHGRLARGGQEGSLGDDHRDRGEAALVQGDVLRDQGAEGVDDAVDP